jgi:hypothetical protein
MKTILALAALLAVSTLGSMGNGKQDHFRSITKMIANGKVAPPTGCKACHD